MGKGKRKPLLCRMGLHRWKGKVRFEPVPDDRIHLPGIGILSIICIGGCKPWSCRYCPRCKRRDRRKGRNHWHRESRERAE